MSLFEDILIYVIVLTGGPCAGKTTAKAKIMERFSGLGFKVYFVPEVATLLLGGGLSFESATPSQVVAYQAEFIKTQKALEASFRKIAQTQGKKSLIICDRGQMDPKAYVSPELWSILLQTEHWHEVALRDQSCHAVMHLVTAAAGAREFFVNNEVRKETLEEAVILDHRLQSAWIGHPHLRIIGNTGSFEHKMHQLLSAIANVVGVPEPLERERKYRINHFYPNGISAQAQRFLLNQTYLLMPDGTAGRVRCREQHGQAVYTFTVKHDVAPGKRVERERIISPLEYLELLQYSHPDCITIVKSRTCFLYADRYFELDEFDQPQGLPTLLEVELERDDEVPELPDFLGEFIDVTDDPRYTNRFLATRPDRR